MHNLSNAALDIISQRLGTEPLNIIEITWFIDGEKYYYADKEIFKDNNEKIQGRILELNNIENVININESGNSQSVSIKLDDSDGVLKNIYDINDIHKRPVKIYQWFTGLNFNDKFLIFEGVITTPIVWNEGDRTLSFDIVSKLEDKEVGFSPEEGTFKSIPDDLIGKAWPLPFGKCLKVPCIQLDPIPQAITLDHTAMADENIHQKITELTFKMIDFQNQALSCAVAGGIEGYNANFINGTLSSPDESDLERQDSWNEKAQEYIQQKAAVMDEISHLTKILNAQEEFKNGTINVHNGDTMPQGQEYTFNLNGTQLKGAFAGNALNVREHTSPGEVYTVQRPPTTNAVSSTDTIPKGNFTWIPPGQSLKFTEPLPVRYIASMIPVSITNVYAHRNFGDTTLLFPIPTQYYSVSTKTFGSIHARVITLTKPLSFIDDTWDDNIFCDINCSIGPNTVEIMEWLINTYTDLNIDATSFNTVKSQVNPFKSNFCLMDRQNIIQVLNDISMQARCALWLKNDKFYLRYLVPEPDYVDTITESDIIEQSLELSHTDTESLVTKLTASYKTNYAQDKEYKIILRHNIKKYGTQSQDINWYIYNHPNLVDLAATFWLIRKSNTWKILNFRTPLHKINLETFDPVRIDIKGQNLVTKEIVNLFSNEPVTGIIQSCSLDTDKMEINFSVWLPVRIGEMVQYDFAYPIDSQVNIFPKKGDFPGGDGPGKESGGSLDSTNNVSKPQGQYTITRDRRTHQDHGNPNPGTNTVSQEIVAINQLTGLSNTTQPRFDYQFRDFAVDPIILPENQKGIFPGVIVSGGPGEYLINLYTQGLDNQPKKNVKAWNFAARQNKEADQSIVQPNTAVMVTIVSWDDPQDKDKKKQEDKNARANGTPVQNRPIKQLSAKYFIPGGTSMAFPCKVGEWSGEEPDTYSISVYEKGLKDKDGNDLEPITVVAKQLSIDPEATIPADTWTIAIKVGGKYFIQTPVWE